jgi:hypothetical protein
MEQMQSKRHSFEGRLQASSAAKMKGKKRLNLSTSVLSYDSIHFLCIFILLALDLADH